MRSLHPSRRSSIFVLTALVVVLPAAGNPRVRELPRTALALARRAFMAATTENGPIKAGDPLTASTTPGFVARFVPEPGKSEGLIIGKALQSLDAGSGTILVQVGAH